MKQNYTITELSAIVNRIARKTPNKGVIASVPDLINVNVLNQQVTHVPLPTGEMNKLHVFLSLAPVEGKRAKQDYFVMLTNGNNAKKAKITEGFNAVKFHMFIDQGDVEIELIGTDILNTSVTLQFTPRPYEHSAHQILLEGDDICENLT